LEGVREVMTVKELAYQEEKEKKIEEEERGKTLMASQVVD
jgi:hypothetical protein